MVHVLAYDLESPNDTSEDYARVIAHIKETFSWCHLEKSVWLIDTEMSAADVRDNVKLQLHDGDLLFVGRLQGTWASWNLGQKRTDWLMSRTF
jgi:hypothetical protein